MSRRIWVAEGVASDGDIYGRALQLPEGTTPPPATPRDAGNGVQRTRGSVLKTHLGDIPSCPCLAALVAPDSDTEPRIAEVADA